MKKIFYTLVTITILNSCVSTHNGLILPANVQIGHRDFKVVKTIVGTANATYVLGIGGNSRNGLINEAKRNMYKSHKLLNNQIISNITVEAKNQYFLFPIFFVKNVIISADVIDFSNKIDYTNLSEGNRSSLENDSSKTEENKTSPKPDKTEVIQNQPLDLKPSELEIKLNQLKKANKQGIAYKKIENVKVGDYVIIELSHGPNIYGQVDKIILSTKKIQISSYPTERRKVTRKLDFKILKKVE